MVDKNLRDVTLVNKSTTAEGGVAGIDLNNTTIPNLAPGTQNTDAVNKAQLDSATANTVKNLNSAVDVSSSKITNLSAGTETTDAVNVQQLLSSIPPLTSPTPSVIWAQASGNLSTTNSGFQFCFGNNVAADINNGLVIHTASQLVALSISASGGSGTPSGTIRLYKNGAPISSSVVGQFIDITITSSNKYKALKLITGFPPLLFNAGDYLNFKTETVTGTVENCIVGAAFINTSQNALNAIPRQPTSLLQALTHYWQRGNIVPISQTREESIELLNGVESSSKFANGFFKVVEYDKIPPFYTADIPDVMYRAHTLTPNKHAFLINMQLIDSELLSLTNETEINKIAPFVNNSGEVLFNLHNKKHCVIIDNEIKYLKYETESG